MLNYTSATLHMFLNQSRSSEYLRLHLFHRIWKRSGEVYQNKFCTVDISLVYTTRRQVISVTIHDSAHRWHWFGLVRIYGESCAYKFCAVDISLEYHPSSSYITLAKFRQDSWFSGSMKLIWGAFHWTGKTCIASIAGVAVKEKRSPAGDFGNVN